MLNSALRHLLSIPKKKIKEKYNIENITFYISKY
jgi:hypothetical protein